MKVLIISDARLHREVLGSLLERVPSVNVVGAIDVDSAFHNPPTQTADAALLDRLSSQSLKVVHSLRRSGHRLPIVVIGVREVESEILACAAAGIDGYVPVNATVEDLVAVLDSAVRGDLVGSPRVAASLYNCARLLRGCEREARNHRSDEDYRTRRSLVVSAS